jgi:tetratricopeptide (TPR) repeat protein
MDRVGVVGFSWGGLSNVVFAMQNSGVRAVVSLDGSISFRARDTRANAYSLYHPDTFRVPLMLLSQSPWRYPEMRDFSFTDELVYSDILLGWVHDLTHINFASTLPKLWGYVADEGEVPTKDVGRIVAGYHLVCRYTKAFLDANVKDSAEAQAFLRRSPRENGIPDDVLSVTRRPAQAAPPLPDQFLEIIRKEGVGKAVRIFKETRALNPSYLVFQPGQLIQLSGEFEARGAVSDATELLELVCFAFPANYNACRRLATVYAANGQVERAIRTYERYAQQNPNEVYSQFAVEAAKALSGRR